MACLLCLIITIMGLWCTSHQKFGFMNTMSGSVMTYPILTRKYKMLLWSFWKTCYYTHHLSPFRIPFILNRQHTNSHISSKHAHASPAFSQYWKTVACNPCTNFWHLFESTKYWIVFKVWACASWRELNIPAAHTTSGRLIQFHTVICPIAGKPRDIGKIDHKGLELVCIEHHRVQVVETDYKIFIAGCTNRRSEKRYLILCDPRDKPKQRRTYRTPKPGDSRKNTTQDSKHELQRLYFLMWEWP